MIKELGFVFVGRVEVEGLVKSLGTAPEACSTEYELEPWDGIASLTIAYLECSRSPSCLCL